MQLALVSCASRDILMKKKRWIKVHTSLSGTLWGRCFWEFRSQGVYKGSVCQTPTESVIKHANISTPSRLNKAIISLKWLQFSSGFATKCVCAKFIFLKTTSVFLFFFFLEIFIIEKKIENREFPNCGKAMWACVYTIPYLKTYGSILYPLDQFYRTSLLLFCIHLVLHYTYAT